jgi:putative toxin-antitoxin system antitoxin component (TIGR02293 family)
MEVAMELIPKDKASRKPAAKPAAKAKAVNIEKFYGGHIKVETVSSLPPEMIRGIYGAQHITRHNIITDGVSPDVFTVLAKSMYRSKEDLGHLLGLSVTTIDRKAKLGEKLSSDQGERIVGMAKLIGQVQAMVEESGDPTGFDAAKWVAEWLDKPVPALDGHRPAEYMKTNEGRELVSRLLAMAQSGAYA